MAHVPEVHINLQDTLDTAFATGDAVQIRTAYTNMGLSHYARKRYDRALECFEEQVLFITDKPQGEAYDDSELEALCFAYGLLSQLYGELGQTEQAGAYNRRCKEVQIDACLQGLDESLGTGPEGGHQGKGKVPSFTALRDQLMTNTEDIAPILLQSPKFPAILHAMLVGGYDVAQQVLQVLLVILAQPIPKVPKKGLLNILMAVSELLWTIMRLDIYTRVENKVMKMSILLLQFLVQWIPSAFDDRVPLPELDRFIRRHVAPASAVLHLWTEVLCEIKGKTKPDHASPHAALKASKHPKPRPPGSELSGQSPSVAKVQLSLSADTRSPSMLTDTSTYDSSETDTLTFVSMPSDDDDLSEAVLTAPPP